MLWKPRKDGLLEYGAAIQKRTLIGLWAIAGYFVSKSIVVAALASKALIMPDHASGALETLRTILPLLKRLYLDPTPSAIVAYLLAVFGCAVAYGILARKQWAAAYVVAFHGIALIRGIAGLFLLKLIGLGGYSDPLSSTWVDAEIASSLFMVGYLLRP